MIGNIECAFIGRVATEATLKTSAVGKPWAAFKTAVGHGEDNTQWVRVVVFGSAAEQLSSTLQKGDKLYVEGNLRFDHWKNAEGQDRTGLSVTAWKAEKVGASAIGRNRPTKPRQAPEGEHHVPSSQNGRRDWQSPLGSKGGFDKQLEDEIPF